MMGYFQIQIWNISKNAIDLYTNIVDHLRNTVNGYKAIKIVNVNYYARHYKLERFIDGKTQWVLIIGHDAHTKIDPIPRTRSAISTVVEDALRTNQNEKGLNVLR